MYNNKKGLNMTLSEKIAKKYVKNIKSIKQLAYENIKLLNDEVIQFDKVNTSPLDNDLKKITQTLVYILEQATTETEAKASAILYTSFLVREINAQMNAETMATLGFRAVTKNFPYLSSNSMGFLTSLMMDEFRQITPFDREANLTIKRICSLAFFPSDWIKDSIEEKTSLSIFYEKKSLDKNVLEQSFTNTKKMKL